MKHPKKVKGTVWLPLQDTRKTEGTQKRPAVLCDQEKESARYSSVKSPEARAGTLAWKLDPTCCSKEFTCCN